MKTNWMTTVSNNIGPMQAKAKSVSTSSDSDDLDRILDRVRKEYLQSYTAQDKSLLGKDTLQSSYPTNSAAK